MPFLSRKLNHLLARVNFPLYTVQRVTERHILVAGGGGSAKTGIKNVIEIYELINDNGTCRAEPVMHYDVGDEAVMNCALYDSGNFFLLFAGMEGSCHVFKLKYDYDTKDACINSKTEHDSNLHLRKQSSNTNDVSLDDNSNSAHVSFSIKQIDSFQTDYSDEPFQKLVKFNNELKILATAGSDGYIRVWKYPELVKIYEIHAHQNDVDDIDISPSDKKIVSISRDGTGKIWNSEDGALISELEYTLPIKSDKKYIFRNCRFGTDDKGALVLFTTLNPAVYKKPPSKCYICKWDPDKCYMKKIVSTGVDMLTVMAISDDGHFIGLGTQEGSVKIYIAFSLQLLHNNVSAHNIFVTGLEFVKTCEESQRIMGGHEASLISISVDNHINIHHVPARSTIGILPLMLFFIVLMFFIFVVMDYVNL